MPHLGGKVLRKLRPLEIEAWHTALRSRVAARTIGHAHRLLGKALRDAAKNDIVSRIVTKEHPAPKVDDGDKVIVQDIASLVDKLRGWRLGEVLALRWNRVDLDGKMIQVREALEQTKLFGVRFKPPKSKAGRRDVTLPDILVDALREHLLFANIVGKPLSPTAVSTAWADFAESIGIPAVTFHALRHTHASQLIDAGVDIVTISKRLGHAKPDITLRVYAHLFRNDDSKAAAAINAAFR